MIHVSLAFSRSSKIADYFSSLLSSYYYKRMKFKYIIARNVVLAKAEKKNDTKII